MKPTSKNVCFINSNTKIFMFGHRNILSLPKVPHIIHPIFTRANCKPAHSVPTTLTSSRELGKKCTCGTSCCYFH